MIHELCFSPRIEDMTDDWVEEHMKDVTVAASHLHNEALKPIFGNARHQGTRESKWYCQVIGNVDSGKSTLVGVLTKGGLDDGRGLARAKVPCTMYRNETKTESIGKHPESHSIWFNFNLNKIWFNLVLSGLQFLS